MAESRSVVTSTIVMAAATCLAVGISAWGIKAQREDAKVLLQAQISAELDKQFDSTEMRKARKAFARELQNNPHKLPREDRVLSFFEKVGIYHRLGRIDDDTTFSAFSDPVELYWAASKEAIKAFRSKEKNSDYFGDFEELNDVFIKQEVKDKGRPESDALPTPAQVKEFLEDEAGINP